MSDKVQLIKEEIERRIENLKISLDKNCVTKESKLDIRGNITTLYGLLKFIDSLPEEPASKDLEEAADKYAFMDSQTYKGVYCTYVDDKIAFKAGAEWQKQKDQESIKLAEESDLDKAAKEHAANLYGEDWMKNEHVQDSGFKAISNFKFGAEWQKEQIIKDSVNGIMDCDDDNEWIEITDKLIVTPSRAGKKVKIIIVKDEQQ